jgi:2-polyprenyl-3-methyl-5-hydroxy-6-metoxy-1,4-benzoquinol methylase
VIHLHEKRYEYLEEINEGVVRQIPVLRAPPRPLVLDVGCGSGALSEAIRKRGYEVWGIEENKEAAGRAAARIDRVMRLNLNQVAAVRAAVGGRTFDYLVFSDVLEHVYDPFTVLRDYLRLVKDGGRVVISVPNALVWTNRLSFLFGRFEYADTGVMDRTHMRWFTFRSAKRLVRAAGCTLERVDYTPFVVRAALPLIKRLMRAKPSGNRRQLIDSAPYRAYMRAVYPVEYAAGFWLKTWLAFRIILVGVKQPGR